MRSLFVFKKEEKKKSTREGNAADSSTAASPIPGPPTAGSLIMAASKSTIAAGEPCRTPLLNPSLYPSKC